MTVAVKNDPNLYLLRAAKGPQSLGPAWPAGAVVEYTSDRFALIGSDRFFTVRKHATLAAVLAEAETAVASGKLAHVTVARAVGKFDRANIYEPVQSLYDVEKYTSPITSEWHAADGEFKAAAGAKTGKLIIEGMASTPAIDREFDIVAPDAFKDSIKAFLDNPVLLFNHNMGAPPIGLVLEVDFSDKGMHVKAEVTDEQVKEWVRAGLLRMFSVQFLIDPNGREFIEPTFDKTGKLLSPAIRRVTKAELVETSIVTVPANRETSFRVKNAAKGYGVTVPELPAALPPYVVEHRDYPVARQDDDWTLDQKTIGLFGPSAYLLCHTFETAAKDRDGNRIAALPHSAVVDGVLKTIPDLVRTSMAQVVARSHDMTDDQRIACWSSLSRRWLDCFKDEPMPEIDKYPAPGEFARVARSCGLVLAKDRYDERSARNYARLHGYTPEVVQDTDGHRRLWNSKSLQGGRGVTVAPGVEVIISGKSAEDNGNQKTLRVGASGNQGHPEKEVVKMAEITKEELVELVRGTVNETLDKREDSSGTQSQQTTETHAGQAEQDGPVEISDDVLADVSASTIATLEAANRGDPVSAEALSAAHEEVEVALNADIDIEVETQEQ